jgi:hypothetical protein
MIWKHTFYSVAKQAARSHSTADPEWVARTADAVPDGQIHVLLTEPLLQPRAVRVG